MFKKNHILVAAAIGACVCAVAFALSDVADNVRVSIRTQGNTTKYSINEIDLGTNQSKVISILTKVSKVSSGPFQIKVDSNTTVVVFASLIENLNQSCPNAKWYVTYRTGPRDVKVLYDARVHPKPHIMWVIQEMADSDDNKTVEDIGTNAPNLQL